VDEDRSAELLTGKIHSNPLVRLELKRFSCKFGPLDLTPTDVACPEKGTHRSKVILGESIKVSEQAPSQA
jgi:hypothetical protein